MGLYQVSRFVGAVLGSGIAITILQLFEVNGQPSLDGYRAAGIAGAALAVLTAAVAWVLPGRTGPARVSGLDVYEERDGRLAAAGLADLTEPWAPSRSPAADRPRARTTA